MRSRGGRLGDDLRCVGSWSDEILSNDSFSSEVLRTDVSGTDVSGIDVSGTDLSGTDVLGTDVLGTDVLGTDFLRTDVLLTDVLRTDVLLTDVLRTDVSFAHVSSTDFSSTVFSSDIFSSNEFSSDDILGKKFCDSHYRRPLYINPQELTSEPTVPSFSYSEGLPDASSSNLGSHSLDSGYPQDYLEEQETRVEGRLPNARQSKEPTFAYQGNSSLFSIYTSLSNQETNQIQGLEASANPDVAYDSSLFSQPQSETEIAVANEDLALGGRSLQTFTARNRNSAGDPIPCEKCDKSFLERYKYNKHIKTHGRTFQCRFPDCSSQGFYRLQDLERHELIHDKGPRKSRKFKCPIPDCKYAIEGIARKDNCDRHIRRKHQTYADNDVG